MVQHTLVTFKLTGSDEDLYSFELTTVVAEAITPTEVRRSMKSHSAVLCGKPSDSTLGVELAKGTRKSLLSSTGFAMLLHSPINLN